MPFNSGMISILINNSFKYTSSTKPNRLDGDKLSLQEATTNLAKNGNDIP
jgi:hypothetical protein